MSVFVVIWKVVLGVSQPGMTFMSLCCNLAISEGCQLCALLGLYCLWCDNTSYYVEYIQGAFLNSTLCRDISGGALHITPFFIPDCKDIVFLLSRDGVVKWFSLPLDVIGICKSAEDVSRITTKNSREVSKRALSIIDQTGKVVTVTLWGEEVITVISLSLSVFLYPWIDFQFDIKKCWALFNWTCLWRCPCMYVRIHPCICTLTSLFGCSRVQKHFD